MFLLLAFEMVTRAGIFLEDIFLDFPFGILK